MIEVFLFVIDYTAVSRFGRPHTGALQQASLLMSTIQRSRLEAMSNISPYSV
jgi:hypothetical protein